MADLTISEINKRLATVVLPCGRPLADFVKRLDFEAPALSIDLAIEYPLGKTERDALIQALGQDLVVKLSVSVACSAHIARDGQAPLPGIKNVIGIASGKGGVGKSTTALNIALALSAAGAAVGLLDADIYGPSVPHMLGVVSKPEMTADKQFRPIIKHGIKTMSMGYLVDAATAMAWRGPMISAALKQLLGDTDWGELDYLIIDLPPGTGDISLTLAKSTPLSAVVLVTTPQALARIDVLKAAHFFVKMSIPVLGIIENMSEALCSACGAVQAVFGDTGGDLLAQHCQVPLLGRIPLKALIRQAADLGTPELIAEKDASLADLYSQVAVKIAAQLALQKKSYAHLFAPVVIEKEQE